MSEAGSATRRRILIDIGPLRTYPDFRRVWLGYLFRQLGAQLTITTVIFQVFKLTNSSLSVGLISLVQVVPGVIGPLFGGAIVDALDRRRLLMLTAVLIAISSTGLAVNSIGNRPALWVLYLCSAATWGLNGIDVPARSAVVYSIVDRSVYTPTTVLQQFVSQMSSIGGPAIGGVLIAIFSKNLDIVYWIDVACSLIALQTVLRLSPKTSGQPRRFDPRAIIEGLQFLRTKRVLQACYLTDMNALLLGLPTSLYPYMALVHFHGGPKTYGLLMASPGVGALLGGVVSGWTGRVQFPGRAAMCAVILWGLAITGFGFAPSLAIALVLLAIAGWGNAVSAAMRWTIMQTETTDEMRGRVSSFQTLGGQIGKLGNAEAGLVASATTPQFSIVSGGIGCVLGMLVISRLIPELVRYRLGQTAPEETAGVT